MIASSTLQFLKDLKKNNTKEWFDDNRSRYELAKKDFVHFTELLIKRIAQFDKAIGDIDPKQCIFRINRDIRFSSNKSPYKHHLAAAISPGGKKSFIPGYYFHLEPGTSYLAGGIWHPEPIQLNAIRQEIDYNADEFKTIILSKAFKNYFGKLSEEEKLKSIPKGYPKDHPEIELLKHKNFIVIHNLSDKELQTQNIIKKITQVFQAMYPLNTFLRRAND